MKHDNTTAPPRLLILASTYPRWANDHEPGFVHELSKRLVDTFDVTVLCPHAPDARSQECMDDVQVHRYRYAPARLETLVNDGGIVINLKHQPWKWLLLPGFLLAQIWAAWRLIRVQRPDVIHAHWLIPQGLVVALLGLVYRRVPPFVVTSHGADLYALRTKPLQALKRFVARRAAALTVVSQAMRDELIRLGVDSSKISVRSMGVDLEQRFRPDSSVQRSVGEILFVGRLVEKKGVRHLIDAMPAILAMCPDAHLTIAGFGPEEQALRAQVRHLNMAEYVQFMGAVTQGALPEFYRRAAVFVAPFVQADNGDVEGLGLVVVEAVGCLCPVVVGAVPAMLDVLDACSDSVVSPCDINALATAVVETLHDSQCAHARAVTRRQRLLKRFSWREVARGYASVLKTVIALRRA
ncbi:MAG: glycosyltransferase [Rhodanobacter sp.]